jgi:hypothetical protein
VKDYFKSSAKYLKLNIPLPYEAMLAEAKALRHRYVEHRGGESKGWQSLTLHGFGENKTGVWKDYGFKTSVEASDHMFWTEAADLCPITKNFLLNNFPCKKFGRVRFMLLEAGGYIGMHSDSNTPLLENINIVLNNPEGCVWTWGDGDANPLMEPGGAYAMNIHYKHAVYNNSDQDRYHIIVARHDSLPEWKALINQSAKDANATGEYITINELP